MPDPTQNCPRAAALLTAAHMPRQPAKKARKMREVTPGHFIRCCRFDAAAVQHLRREEMTEWKKSLLIEVKEPEKILQQSPQAASSTRWTA